MDQRFTLTGDVLLSDLRQLVQETEGWPGNEPMVIVDGESERVDLFELWVEREVG